MTVWFSAMNVRTDAATSSLRARGGALLSKRVSTQTHACAVRVTHVTLPCCTSVSSISVMGSAACSFSPCARAGPGA